MENEEVMRVILSRKGFDSKYGGVPSPILTNGRMISLPIPDRDAPITYRAIQRDGLCLGDLAADLTRGKIPPTYRAHLDPDLEAQAVARPVGWRPAFGQSGAALCHLRKEGVMPGDLFLFFGWYRPVERVANQWRYVRDSQSVHALWGWMRIGAIHACGSLPKDVAGWATGHPHMSGPHPAQNDLLIAADDLVVAGRNLPGAGIFTSRQERVLTRQGATRSVWNMPAWMSPEFGMATLSYHGDRRRWSAVDTDTCQLRSAAIGQEFVLNVAKPELLDQWLTKLFTDIA